MKRLFGSAAAGAAGLLIAVPALAAGPTLSVLPASSVFGAAGSTVLRFEDDGASPPVAMDVYAPAGYGVELNQPYGSTIGSVDARAKTAAGTEVQLAGAVKTVDPAAYADAAASCTPTRLVHDAVWTAGLNASGVSTRVPVFVDRAPALGLSAHVRACLPQTGTPGFDVRLTRATLTLNDVFTNPAESGDYRWTTLFTYAGPESPPTSTETLVRLPPRLTLARTLIRPRGKRTFVRLSGTLTEHAHPVRGVRVEVLAGGRASALGRLAYTTSYVGGKFSIVTPLRKRTFFRARAAVPFRQGPLSECRPFTLLPEAVCTSLTYAPSRAQSPTVVASPTSVRVRP